MRETGHEDVLAVVERRWPRGARAGGAGEAERGEEQSRAPAWQENRRGHIRCRHVEGERDREHDQGRVVRQEKRREDVHVGLETRTRD